MMTASMAMAYLKHLPANEPVFVLRAQDKLAGPTVSFWADFAEGRGVHPEKVAGAREVARRIEQWVPKKLPD